MKTFMGFVIGILVALIIYFAFIYPSQIRESEKLKRSGTAEFVLDDAAEKKLKAVLDEKQSFIKRNMERTIRELLNENAILLEAEIVRFDPIRDIESDIRWIVTGLAFPLYFDRIDRDRKVLAVLSLTFDIRESKASRRRAVFGPSEAGLSASEIERLRKETSDYLRGIIQAGDQRFEILWKVRGMDGTFRTHALMGSDGKLKFESMLFFSYGKEDLHEWRDSNKGRTTVHWNGDVKNVLGLKAISWQASATYAWDNGIIEPAPEGGFQKLISLPLWHIDHENSRVQAIRQSPIRQRGKDVGHYRIDFSLAWTAGFQKPLKLTKLGLELPDLSTGRNQVARSYHLYGDGTVLRP